MNVLRVCTRQREEGVWQVLWMTGLIRKGTVLVEVSERAGRDYKTLAELVAIQHLLEDRNVCGHNKAGAGLKLVVSCGSIRKLMKETSSKSYLAPYANFLRTRFVGFELEVDVQGHEWAETGCDCDVEKIPAGPARITLIEVGGFGLVELSGHAVDKFIARMECEPTRAWRRMMEYAKEAGKVSSRNSPWGEIRHEGRSRGFAFNVKHNLVFAIAEPPGRTGFLRVATVYVAAEM